MEIRQKQEYERPTMQIVELQRSAPLVCTSASASLNVTYEEEDF